MSVICMSTGYDNTVSDKFNILGKLILDNIP